VEFAGVVLLGYLLGSCPWGYWLVKLLKHEDIRRVGSGNVGASNVFRTYGTSLGLPVLALDVLKGFVPALVGVVYVSHVCAIVGGAAAMLGHWRPLFLKFERGGKMVATAGGIFFAIAPLVAGSGVAIWVALWLVFGYASIASIVASAFLPIGAVFYGYPRSVVAFAAVTFVGVLFLHRPNLVRLWHRKETRSRVALLPRLWSARS
jgi:glycerol-3-phosphate acyltransferase PlsY